MKPLEGLVALVTGGGSGIGAATCERLARDGAAVAVNGRSEDAVRDTVERCRALGVEAVPALADVSDPDAVQAAVAAVVERLGGLDIAVNNAGMQKEVPFLETDVQTWRSQLAVDLDGAFYVAHAAATHMAGARRRGDRQRHERPRAPAPSGLRPLLRRQGRPRDAHQGHGPRARAAGHPRGVGRARRDRDGDAGRPDRGRSAPSSWRASPRAGSRSRRRSPPSSPSW